MNKAALFGCLAGIGLAANLGVWFASKSPHAGDADPFWAVLEGVKVPGRSDVAPHFPEALRADEGRRVRISGVAFITADGLEGDRVKWFVLMPPSRYGCCGVSCDPRPEMSVFVDCAGLPWSAGGRRQVMVTAEGRLRLERGTASWCLTTLEEAVVHPAEP